ncbi:hypothetical protein DPMN_039338 [Dreissena polymorpha]|uniref:Uncharacterized protein n=1 Tax=Dreissena polymorpha TaxID=45954 RepID=A0A9D4RR74_DREPO|nr:hypothetical protein DPMN_039338 [Dreissena polymorpha]
MPQEEYRNMLVAASGEALCVKRKTQLDIEIDKESFLMDTLLAEIENDLILGLGLLEAYGCRIDIFDRSINFRNSRYSFEHVPAWGCFRISVSEDISIPARSEMIVMASVPDFKKMHTGPFLVEPSPK